MGPRYHLGCGDTRLPGYVNIDVRPTSAVDAVMDLNELSIDSASCFFSHAFFEHLRRDARIPHLVSALHALDDDGFACYLGMPDFHAVARLYLDAGPGTLGPVFDLYNVYRYTHGEPDAAEGYYTEQLHKSLFDHDELDMLLTSAGFPAYALFSYVFPGEPVAVSLGFYASKKRRPRADIEDACKSYLSAFDGRYLEMRSLSFGAIAERSAMAARVAASPVRRVLRRYAHAASVRLARI
jgi:predicted SAM-dependent methyltransferase